MRTIIPKNNKCLMEIKDRKDKCFYILSPFMYMNYNDAIKETLFLLDQVYNNVMVIDFTGLTVEFLRFFRDRENLYRNSSIKNINKMISHSDFSLVEEQIQENKKYIEVISCSSLDVINNLKNIVLTYNKYEKNGLKKPQKAFVSSSYGSKNIVVEEGDHYYLLEKKDGFIVKINKKQII